MLENDKTNTLLLSISIFLGLTALGFLLGDAAIRFKEYERTVRVKGLAERELPADIVIWPIQFSAAHNDLQGLYNDIDKKTGQIRQFLVKQGIASETITVSTPAITDTSAQQYGKANAAAYRYTATQTVTVYSENIATVRKVMGNLNELGKQGIAFTGDHYQAKTEYIFTRLNAIKPQMIEEATMKAREVAVKFAQDSGSQLGKIKRAAQGQFSIQARDKNNPHIKRIRVVSTVEYYLSD